MAITLDMLRSWRDPQGMIRARIAMVREDRALATVVGAGILAFVAQMPALARAAHENPDVPLDARMGGALFFWLFAFPLLAYALAFVSHGVARLLGGQGSGFGARMALFWAFLCTTPAMLFLGLLRGFLGETPAVSGIGLLVFAGFLYLWITMLRAVERA